MTERFHALEKAELDALEMQREALGICFCPTCKQDTMPCERTGICFFCDRQLVAVAAKPGRRAA